MSRGILLSAIFCFAGLSFSQVPQVEVEVKEKAEEEKVKIPVEKEKKPKTETTIKGEQLLIQSGGGVNIFKAIELTPSVNVQTDDAYGLGGGSIRIRGFDNTQIGITIDGMPLNDSGNFALYPHEYADVENLEAISVERGAVNKRSPFYVEIGGAIRVSTKPPKNKLGLEYNLRLGTNRFRREFVRFDTGLLPGGLKVFASFSHSSADKWKGPGKHPDFRDHTAIGAAQSFGRMRWEVYFDNNSQLNYFYRSLSYNQAKDLGSYRRFDYNPVLIFPGGSGTAYAANQSAILNNNVNYYKFYKNPYYNRLFRGNFELDITDSITLSLKPYYWWGRGSGTSAVSFRSGSNSYIAFRESFNYTDRPGVLSELKLRLPIGNLQVGYWHERSELRQWQPSRPVRVRSDGSFELLTNTTGTPSFIYNYIQKTITTTNTPYASLELKDIFRVMDVQLGIRYAQVKRDFTNYNNLRDIQNQPLPYLPEDQIFDYPLLKRDQRLSYSKTYHKLLPSLGLGINIAEGIYPYFAYAKNFRVPQNFIGTIPTNVSAQFVVDQLKPEESDSYDVGVRFDFGRFYIVPSAYYVNYKNRLIRTVDPNDPTLVYLRNAGKVKAYGAELEVGAVPFSNLSLYASASYNQAKFKDENFFDGSTRVPIKDKTVPDTPKYMFKLGFEYRIFGFKVVPSLQYIGSRYGNFTNTEKIDSYTLVNLYIDRSIYKRLATVYVDVYNLTDKKFIGRISPGATSGAYYVGAPFTVSVGLKGRF